MSFLGEDPRLRAIHETLKAARAPRPRTAILHVGDPMHTIGPWVSEVIRRAGGIDVLATDATADTAALAARPVTAEALCATDPELIVFACDGAMLDHTLAALAGRLAEPDWAWARDRRLHAMEALWLMEPGPTLIDAVETLAPCIAPTLFAPAPSSRTRPLTFPSH